MVIRKSDPNRAALVEQNRKSRQTVAERVDQELAEHAEQPKPKQYRLSGEVETVWHDSGDESLVAYNEAVFEHNRRYKRESNRFAYLDRIPWGNGGCYETLADSVTRHQWPNPTRGHGWVYLEIRETKQ